MDFIMDSQKDHTHALTKHNGTMMVGFNEGGVFTFIDFIALSVHLSLQDVALNKALHNILRRGEERRRLNREKVTIAMCQGIVYSAGEEHSVSKSVGEMLSIDL